MNQILFGIIGLLLLAIVEVGAVALYQHPEAVGVAVEHASDTVQDAVADIKQITGTVQPATTAGVQSAVSDDREEEDDDNSATTQQTIPTTKVTSAGGITMAEVSKHNTAASCYSAISGSVYDLTSFIAQHPGGSAAITSLCGVDGTDAYNGQHGTQRRPANELASLKIGLLAQ